MGTSDIQATSRHERQQESKTKRGCTQPSDRGRCNKKLDKQCAALSTLPSYCRCPRRSCESDLEVGWREWHGQGETGKKRAGMQPLDKKKVVTILMTTTSRVSLRDLHNWKRTWVVFRVSLSGKPYSRLTNDIEKSSSADFWTEKDSGHDAAQHPSETLPRVAKQPFVKRLRRERTIWMISKRLFRGQLEQCTCD